METQKEILKVKIVNKDETKTKKYNLKDIKIIKDVEVDTEEEINDNDLKELEKLEELDKKDMNN